MAESAPAAVLANVHALIEHLIRAPEDRSLLKGDPTPLFDRFDIPDTARPVLRSGSRDELSALGIHGNYVIKWLIWSGRPTMPFFPIAYYFDRRG
jgi:hypothetical protein